MATITRVFALGFVAKRLGEEPELVEAIIANDDNLTYGAIITVHTDTDEAIIALTPDGIDELEDMLKSARRSSEHGPSSLMPSYLILKSSPGSRPRRRGDNRAVTADRIAREVRGERAAGSGTEATGTRQVASS